MKAFLILVFLVVGQFAFSQETSKKILKFDEVEIIRNDIPYD